ncbi:MAG: esterase family protein [Bacteroidetes bacterium]|nr:esterase family protein [Bacteroidota bacterium]
MKKYLLTLTILIFSFHSNAATVDTVSIFSNAMHKAINCVIVKPSVYKKKTLHFPVVYLLHGYSGSYSDWIKKVPQIQNLADEDSLIIVCPDGAYSSWYFDSPIDSTYRYETYVSTEVVQYVDAHYKTIAGKNHRAITGLSMGGHGGLFLGLRHPETFGAAGSMSGGVDLSESRNRFDIIKRIGDTIASAQNWYDYSVVNMVEHYANTPVKIIFDCGVNDFFIKGNRKLHENMIRLHIKHDYIERPGEHNWEYWSNAVIYQLYFFKQFFNSAKE